MALSKAMEEVPAWGNGLSRWRVMRRRAPRRAARARRRLRRAAPAARAWPLAVFDSPLALASPAPSALPALPAPPRRRGTQQSIGGPRACQLAGTALPAVILLTRTAMRGLDRLSRLSQKVPETTRTATISTYAMRPHIPRAVRENSTCSRESRGYAWTGMQAVQNPSHGALKPSYVHPPGTAQLSRSQFSTSTGLPHDT